MPDPTWKQIVALGIVALVIVAFFAAIVVETAVKTGGC